MSVLIYIALSFILVREAIKAESVTWLHYVIAVTFIVTAGVYELNAVKRKDKKFLSTPEKITLNILIIASLITSIIL